jgi:hypothetical protein
MRLVSEAAEDRDLAERLPCLNHQLARPVDAPLDQEGVWRVANAVPKPGRELARPETDQIGQFAHTQWGVEMRFDVAGHPLNLPRGQRRPVPTPGFFGCGPVLYCSGILHRCCPSAAPRWKRMSRKIGASSGLTLVERRKAALNVGWRVCDHL